MRSVVIMLGLVLCGCEREPVFFPVSEAKYGECLEHELREIGRNYAFHPEPSTSSRTMPAVSWFPASKDEEKRVWCETAFCYLGTRDVKKGAFPDMCAAYQ
jgi:hypothetical protein